MKWHWYNVKSDDVFADYEIVDLIPENRYSWLGFQWCGKYDKTKYSNNVKYYECKSLFVYDGKDGRLTKSTDKQGIRYFNPAITWEQVMCYLEFYGFRLSNCLTTDKNSYIIDVWRYEEGLDGYLDLSFKDSSYKMVRRQAILHCLMLINKSNYEND